MQSISIRVLQRDEQHEYKPPAQQKASILSPGESINKVVLTFGFREDEVHDKVAIEPCSATSPGSNSAYSAQSVQSHLSIFSCDSAAVLPPALHKGVRTVTIFLKGLGSKVHNA